jgi:predicted LPLAT superfamily acyltransferase
MSVSADKPRNAGPAWGFSAILWADRWLPRPLFNFGLWLGAWIAVVRMPAERKASQDYLEVVRGRPATWRDVAKHFLVFTQFLVLRLRAGQGAPHQCVLAPENAAEFDALIESGEPALFGTFHFGRSDLLGFLLATRGRNVAMIRMRVGNSDDTRWLGKQFGDAVSFIWVNDPSSLLFTLKDSIEAGLSLAMKCDRLEFTARTDVFQFLGARRVFPFTIYHLAILFGRPVMFCLGVPAGENETRVLASPVFRPDPALEKTANLRAAHAHFQAVLARLETLIGQYPELWFNFLPLNPAEAPLPERLPTDVA